MGRIIRAGLAAPEYTLMDGLRLGRGASFVAQHMQSDVADEWMMTEPILSLPVLFALGRHDCNTPSDAAAEFLGSIRAPRTEAIWFESSAHFPFWEEPLRFAEVLRQALQWASTTPPAE